MIALIERKNNNVVRLYHRKRGGYTTKRLLASRKTINPDKRKEVRAWCERRGYKLRFHSNDYPFLILDTDTKMVNPKLAKKLNKLCYRMKRYGWIGEGLRTRARQQELWNQYVARNYAPPLTARPGTSNHETGNAADFSLFMYGRDQAYTNVGKIRKARVIMRKLSLCLPVPGEPWHVEIGRLWRV